MWFIVDKVNDLKCLSDLVVSGCIVGKVYVCVIYVWDVYRDGRVGFNWVLK